MVTDITNATVQNAVRLRQAINVIYVPVNVVNGHSRNKQLHHFICSWKIMSDDALKTLRTEIDTKLQLIGVLREELKFMVKPGAKLVSGGERLSKLKEVLHEEIASVTKLFEKYDACYIGIDGIHQQYVNDEIGIERMEQLLWLVIAE